MENTFLNTQQDIVPAANAITISPAVEQYVQRYRQVRLLALLNLDFALLPWLAQLLQSAQGYC